MHDLLPDNGVDDGRPVAVVLAVIGSVDLVVDTGVGLAEHHPDGP
jgi:hypothetical protein